MSYLERHRTNVKMKTVCKKNTCTGCSSCLEICNSNAISLEKKIDNYNAIINEDKCRQCNRCYSICQQNDEPILSIPRMWKQGWCKDENIRKKAASGGVATSISKAFIQSGGYVYGCLYEKGDFVFKEAPTEVDIFEFCGSKYIKSNPQGIYNRIKDRLKNGDKVLFIGLPCQVEAVKRFVGSNLQKKLFLIDLICHGTPAPVLLEFYLAGRGYAKDQVKNVEFRRKNDYRLFLNNKNITLQRVQDIFVFSFLRSLNYTDNCYECKFATINRCSDLTLGDAWGSKLEEGQRKLGISLMLAQTKKGITMISDANIEKTDIDLNIAIDNNKQLKAPATQIYRDKFFKLIKKGKSYDYAVFRCYPKIYIRQEVKKLLFKIHIMQKDDKDKSE